MSFENLSERLTALQDSNAQLRELIERLATIKFQPGSIPLDSDDGGVIAELTSEIHQTIRDQDEDFELLQEEVYDLDSGRPGSPVEEQKQDLDRDVKKAIKELKTCQIAFRRAQLIAKRSLEAAQRAERDALIQSYLEPHSSTSSPGPEQKRRPQKLATLSKEEKEINASSDVTAALRRTHEMMTQELSRSQFAHETLKESTAALAQLSETYSTLDTLLSSSKNLLGTLLRSQKSDTWYLETAFYILAVTIAWLVWRRLLYGPTWWLLWFPIKVFFKSWMGIFTTMGIISGSNSDVSISSVVETPTIVHNSATRGPRASLSGARAPSINVGGGGRGAPMRPIETPASIPQASPEESMPEKIGKIIGEGSTVEADDLEGKEDIENHPNPKKRMWEEDKEAAKEAKRVRDEL